MAQALAVISIVVSAVGAGVQYAGAQSAAKTSDTLALLNAQAQRQSIDQAGQVSAMESSINGVLAKKDQAAAEANAKMLAGQAELETRQSVEATRRSREEASRFAAQQVASLAKGGFADTTGSPLALLADTGMKSQQEADRIRFEDEQARRSMYRDVSMQRNQGVLAGLNVTGQRLSGLAAAQSATQQQAQARLDYYGQRATASAARATATGNLINQAGGLAYQGYGVYRNAPRKGGSIT